MKEGKHSERNKNTIKKQRQMQGEMMVPEIGKDSIAMKTLSDVTA